MHDPAGGEFEAAFLDPTAPIAVQRIGQLTSMTRDELDQLPIGAIRLDRDGVIQEYNAAEAMLAERDRADVIGRSFFTDVAPCTNVQEFAGRFRTSVGSDKPAVAFPFVFKFPKKNVIVTILMHFERDSECGWIFVRTNQ